MTTFSHDQNDYFDTRFEALQLSGQQVRSVTFETCRFENCDLSQATFTDCDFVDCHFINCNMSILTVDFCRFNEVEFENCKVIGIDWTRVNWPGFVAFSPLKFINCILNDSTFFGLSLKEMVIEGCTAHDVDFREGDFCDANFSHTDFSNSLFNQTDLKGADFTQAVNYRIDINHNQISKAKFSRYEALSLLESLDIELVG